MREVRYGLPLGLLSTAVVLCASTIAFAQQVPAGVTLFNAATAKWSSRAGGTPGGGLGASGEQVNILGDPAKPGPYVLLTKPHPARLGEGPSSRPHTHPDSRTYTVISGTWYVGFGSELDESKLIALPAGSYYVEPAGVPHFVLVKDEGTVVQVTGNEPSRVIPVTTTGSR